MSETAKLLEKFDIPFEINIYSAHRCTEEGLNYVIEAEKKGVEVIIASAGKAAHLPGVLASHTNLPVIGVPQKTSDLGGVDSLYSIVQMPAGVPVATMAIGKAGMRNAAIFCAQVTARYDKKVLNHLEKFKQNKCRIPA